MCLYFLIFEQVLCEKIVVFFFAVVVVFKYAGVPYFSFSIFGTMQLLLFGVIVNNLI